MYIFKKHISQSNLTRRIACLLKSPYLITKVYICTVCVRYGQNTCKMEDLSPVMSPLLPYRLPSIPVTWEIIV